MCTRTASLYADRTKCGPLTSDVISKSVHCATDDEAYQSLRGWCPQDCQGGSDGGWEEGKLVDTIYIVSLQNPTSGTKGKANRLSQHQERKDTRWSSSVGRPVVI
eukprot:scaffold4320_cov375-Alexandrium_tamarense.AAC.1